MGGVAKEGDEVARRLRLRDLLTLRAVAEAGSMGRAASRLALSQPAISKALAEMERTVGAPLLERSSNGVEVTAYGRVLLARGAAALDELRLGVEEIRFLADPTGGEVRVGATEPMTAMVSRVVDQLSARHARLRFQVEVAPTHELLAAVRGRALDLAVTRMAEAEMQPDLRLDVLFHDALAVIADRGHALARRRRRIELGTLLEQPWAIAPQESFIGSFVAQAFRSRGLVPPRAAVVSRSVQMWVAMLRTGRFLSVGPSAMLRFPEHYPGLAALPVDLADTRRPIALVSLARRAPAPAARLFAECARGVAEGIARLSPVASP